MHGVSVGIPTIKITDYADGLGVGCPYSEEYALGMTVIDEVGTEELKGMIVGSLMEEVEAIFINDRNQHK